MSVLGIDPGKTGGLALLADDWVLLEPIPVDETGLLDTMALARWLNTHRTEIKRAYLEYVQPMPFNGSIGSFKLGRAFGELRVALTLMGIPFKLVAPAQWSKEFPHGVTETTRSKREPAIKRARRAIVQQLFPTVDLRESERSKVEHSGMADALLIAEFGRRQINMGIS